jgi:integrase
VHGHVGELKSIRTHPEFLRRGVAAAVLEHIPHIVPLPRQALALLVELHGLTGHSAYLFPNVRTMRLRFPRSWPPL